MWAAVGYAYGLAALNKNYTDVAISIKAKSSAET